MSFPALETRIMIGPKTGSSSSRLVAVLKSVTSRQLKEKFSHFLSMIYWDGGGICERRVFLSTVGVNEATIRA
jgi:REP element-mobilizing transposase RayT